MILLYLPLYVTLGTFTAVPSEGVELKTVFKFTASFWDDVDIPLTYELWYASSTSGKNLLRSRSDDQLHYSVLPSIVPGAENMTVFLSVYDSQDASSIAQVLVTVHLDSLDVLKLRTYFNSALDGQSAEKTLLGAVIASESMNKIECTLAPVCWDLNRYNCSTTSNTCGECLPSFVGEVGHKNSLCMNQTQLVLGQGIIPQKTCISESCSGHGACVAFDVFTKAPVLQCDIQASTCMVQCICEAEYKGSACNMTTVEFNQRKSLALTLLEYMRSSESSDVATVSRLKQAFLNSYIGDIAYFTQSRSYELISLQRDVLDSLPRDNLYDAVTKTFSLLEAMSNADALVPSTPHVGHSRRLATSSIGTNASEISLHIFELFSKELVAGQHPVIGE